MKVSLTSKTNEYLSYLRYSISLPRKNGKMSSRMDKSDFVRSHADCTCVSVGCHHPSHWAEDGSSNTMARHKLKTTKVTKKRVKEKRGLSSVLTALAPSYLPASKRLSSGMTLSQPGCSVIESSVETFIDRDLCLDSFLRPRSDYNDNIKIRLSG